MPRKHNTDCLSGLQDYWKFKTTNATFDTKDKDDGYEILGMIVDELGGRIETKTDGRFLIEFSEWTELEKAMDKVMKQQGHDFSSLVADCEHPLIPCKHYDGLRWVEGTK